MKIYRLQEFKTNQLRKLYLNGNITEEQYEIADEFFKKHSSFEKEIDWNKGLNITWDELEKVINKERSTKSQTKKKIRKGLEGFEEGKDYLILDEGIYNGEPWVAYQPFTWEASRMIASHYVEPSKNKSGKIKAAEWCTAYQKDRDYWDDHNEIEAFIYICGESIPTKKVAISISDEDYDASHSEFLCYTDDLNFNIWDFDSHNYTIEKNELLEVVPDLYDLINKAYSNWKSQSEADLLSKLRLNPKTGKYDYDGILSRRELKNFRAEDGDGFTIKFGTITGGFDCASLRLTSLKGAPQTVFGWFDCSANYITSLEGAPQEVTGDFDCSINCLTSLKGAPQTVGGYFNCSNNPRLRSLNGIGKVQGEIYKGF